MNYVNSQDSRPDHLVSEMIERSLPPEQRVDEFGVPEGWCDADHCEHDWEYGMLECRRCQADLSEWNDEFEAERDA